VSETRDPHLRDDVLAAYLDQALGTTARSIADTHLADCASCREELVALSTLARSTSKRRRVLRVAGPLAAVAAGVLIVMFSPQSPAARSGAPSIRMRETTGVGTPRSPALVAVAPVDGDMIRPDSSRPTRFIWKRDAPDAGYRLTLTDEGGSVRWSIDTSDTTVTLPDSVPLQRGQTYYWYIDALGGDGGTRTSGPRRLSVAP